MAPLSRLSTEQQKQLLSRRAFLGSTVTGTTWLSAILTGSFMPPGQLLLASPAPALSRPDPELRTDWLELWERNILARARARYCDRELGEQLGWLMSPFLSGFYHGWLATGDRRWVERLADWAESWMARAETDPDGFPSWPKQGGASTSGVPDFYIDNQLGEFMALEPLLEMAVEIQQEPELRQWNGAARAWIELAERLLGKWEKRGCWREVQDGGLWVAPPFGINRETGQWTEGHRLRKTDGFSLPANKQNHIARSLIALHKATDKAVYRDRAEMWWQLMRARMRLREEGKYFVWNYWDPAGPWDYRPDGRPKHWVGVHPNGGYYGIDVHGIVTAWEHHLVFAREDIERLIATNRDYMWNQQLHDPAFKRLDGGQPDPRWKNSAGVLWTALVPYDAALRAIFEANHNPSSWGAVSSTPRYFTPHAQAARPLQN